MQEIEFTKQFECKLTPDDFSEDFQLIVHDYKCPLCKGVYYNPYVDKCGHVFCKDCITKYLEITPICPFSKMELTTVHLNKLVFMTDILEKQTVKCKNRNNCCSWNGKLSELGNHMENDCKRQIILCPHLGCSSKIFREDKDSHCSVCDYRIVNCEFCKLSIPFIEVINHHQVCPKFIMDCSQKCGTKVERQEMDLHIEEICTNTIVDCPYSHIGCKHSTTKKELLNHLTKQNNEHMLFLFFSFLKSEKKRKNLDSKLTLFLAELEEKLSLFGDNNMESDLLKLREIKDVLARTPDEKNDDIAEILSALKISFFFNNLESKNESLEEKIRNLENKEINSISNNLNLNLNPLLSLPVTEVNSEYSSNYKLLGNKRRKLDDFIEPTDSNDEFIETEKENRSSDQEKMDINS